MRRGKGKRRETRQKLERKRRGSRISFERNEGERKREYQKRD